MTRAFYVLPALPAGLVNSEAVRAARLASEAPKMVAHGPKLTRITACPKPKVPDEIVRAIRWASEHERKPVSRVAREFGLELQAARAFIEYRTRSHLDPALLPPGYVWPLQDPPPPV